MTTSYRNLSLKLCLFIGCFVFFYGCDRDDVAPTTTEQTLTEDTPYEDPWETMPFQEFEQTADYQDFQQQFQVFADPAARGGCVEVYATWYHPHVLEDMIRINGVETLRKAYVMGITSMGITETGRGTATEEPYFDNLMIVKVNQTTSSYLMRYDSETDQLLGMYYLPPGEPPVPYGCGGSITVETSCTCEGQHPPGHSECCCGDCEPGTKGSSKRFDLPPCSEFMTIPCAFGGIGGYSPGTDDGPGSGNGGTYGDEHPPKVFLDPGEEEEHYPDGTATPPHNWPIVPAPPTGAPIVEMPGKTLITILGVQQGSEAAYNWLNDAANLQAHNEILNFLNEHTENNVTDPEAIAFANEVIVAYIGNDFTQVYNLPVFTQDPYDVWGTLSQAEKDLIKSFPMHAYQIYKNRPIAENATDLKFGYNGRNDKSDAFRHAYFNAINTMDIGSYMAELFADAHESEVPTSLVLEKQMDLFNNAVGHNAQIDFTNHTDSQLVNDIFQALLNGDLRYLSPIDHTASPPYDLNRDGIQDCPTCLNGIILTTALTPTNQ